jgi:hypothetical protein
MGMLFDLKLWRLPTLPGLIQVSSADPGLTSLFGMGRGEQVVTNKLFVDLWYGKR